MQSCTKLFSLAVLVVLLSNFSNQAVIAEEATDDAAKQQQQIIFPYIAEITADNVNMRSGPGTNYYSCGQLNTSDRVKVVASQFSWSRIVPPEGSFSWISKQYVEIDPNNPDFGIVTGDSVRVYAGSDYVKPIHSTTVQLTFNRNDKVQLLGEEAGDYYKIAAPQGAYLWVSTQYITMLGGVDEVSLSQQPQTTEPAEEQKQVLVPTNLSVEAEKLAQYQALEEQIKAERDKPMKQQNYDAVKKELTEIANTKQADKAIRYAEYALKQIGRFELAQAVQKQVELQAQQLEQASKRIEKARDTKLTQVPDLRGFAAVGRFEPSTVYDARSDLKHWRIIDDVGQTVCYALPDKTKIKFDLNPLQGKKVGLIGTIEPHPQTSSALVIFTEIVDFE